MPYSHSTALVLRAPPPVTVAFAGCHGKGPWDGLGAMVKTKVGRDLTNGQVLTPSGDMDSALEVAQHARATFCAQDGREHAYFEINEIVVLYLDASEIPRTRTTSHQWSAFSPITRS